MKKLASLLVLIMSVNAMANIQITEWMYKGTNGEFVELTNVGTTAIDMTGWSYSDTDEQVGDVSLSAFGIINSGQSVILTDAVAAAFISAWNLSASVAIIGGNTNSNLGSEDEIHIYNASGVEVDCLTYSGNPKTNAKSCTIPQADFDLTTASGSWTLSSVGDVYGSWTSSGGDIGNPGYNAYTIPEPATIFILGASAMVLRFRKR